jgi:cytochrome c biogenesis protein CcdA
VVLVFWGGAVASLSPCLAVRLPVLLGYVAGSSESKKRALLLTALFGLGMVLSSVVLGTLAASTGNFANGFLHVNKFFFWVFGTALVIAGVVVCGLVGPRLLPQQWRPVAERLSQAGLVGAVLLGLLAGLTVIPACPACGAGLVVLGTVVAAKNLSTYGIVLFISFALGQALPLLAVGVLTAVCKPNLIRRLRKRMCSVEQRLQLLTGNLLMVLGIYYLVVG